MSLKDSNKSTCSPASADGPARSGSRDGPTVDLFGRQAAPALLSASPANSKSARNAKASCLCGALDELARQYARLAVTHGLPTPATYGRKFGGYQPSDALNESLVSRLRASRDWSGLPGYGLRWKSSITLLGLPTYRLLAHRLPTFDNESGLWPTPTRSDTRSYSEESIRKFLEDGNVGGHHMDLNMAAQLALWPTPMASQRDRSLADPDKVLNRKQEGRQQKLEDIVRLAIWPTPSGTRRGAMPPEKLEEYKRKGSQMTLENIAALSIWATPIAPDHKDTPGGTTPINGILGRQVMSYRCSTENSGPLNPAHSRWLMGFPPVWDEHAPTVTRSSRKSRAGSSSSTRKERGCDEVVPNTREETT